jgi:hypothetical protein
VWQARQVSKGKKNKGMSRKKEGAIGDATFKTYKIKKV